MLKRNEEIKQSQMVIVKGKRRITDEDFELKGMVLKNEEQNLTILTIEGVYSYFGYSDDSIEWGEITEIKRTRFPKEVSDCLKEVLKNKKEAAKLNKQISKLNSELQKHQQKINISFEQAKKFFVEKGNANTTSLLEYVTKEIREKIKNRCNKTRNIESVSVSHGYNEKKQKYELKVMFYNYVSRYFSKESCQSRFEYEDADKTRLYNDFLPKVKKDWFHHSVVSGIDESRDMMLGDKGSIQLKNEVVLLLNEAKFKKNKAQISEHIIKTIHDVTVVSKE